MSISLRAISLLSSLSALALAAAPAAAAQPDDPPAPQASDRDPADETSIIVTGTRRTDRTVADSPVPVDVIGAEAIANSGQTETNKILNNLVPSFNFPQPSIADGTDALRPATLRGLSPDQTLVLVNGKRRHVSALLNINGTVGRGSAAVDLNLIPGLAISRIEVLRDGASSQYGSDAIAGVINIQLQERRPWRPRDRDLRPLSHHARTTSPTSPACRPTRGQPVPRSRRQPRLRRQQRRRAARPRRRDVHARRQFRPADRRSGFVNFTAEYRDRNPTNRAGYDLRPNYNRPTAAFDPRELTFDRLEFRYGDAETEDYQLLRQRRHAARRRLGALRLRLLRQPRRPQRRQLPQPERRRQPRLRRARARPRRPTPPISCR